MLFVCQTITTVTIYTLLFLKVLAFFFFNKDTISKLSFFSIFFFRYEDRPDIFHQDILQTQSAIGTVFFS